MQTDDAHRQHVQGLELDRIGIPHLLKGEVTENVGTHVDSHSLRQPLETGEVTEIIKAFGEATRRGIAAGFAAEHWQGREARR